MFEKEGTTLEVEVPPFFIRPASISCYKDGDIVIEYPEGPPEHYEEVKQHGFGIAINEPGIVECKPLVPFS